MEAWVEGWQDAFGGGARKERVGVRSEIEGPRNAARESRILVARIYRGVLC